MLRKCYYLIVVLALSFNCLSYAGEKVDSWVIEDFESYNSKAEMMANEFDLLPLGGENTAGPWYDLWSLRVKLDDDVDAMPAEIESFDIDLTIGDPNGINDPNGYTAIDEVDVDGPRAMALTMKTNADAGSYKSAHAAILSKYTGLPIHTTTVPIPNIGNVPMPCTDLTQWDYLSIKFKNRADNDPWDKSAFEIIFLGPDMADIGFIESDRTAGRYGSGILSQAIDVWHIIEFSLDPENVKGGSSFFGMDNVVGFAIGPTNDGNKQVTCIIDEITVYRESGECEKYIQGDVNLDCSVDLDDMSELAADWLE